MPKQIYSVMYSCICSKCGEYFESDNRNAYLCPNCIASQKDIIFTCPWCSDKLKVTKIGINHVKSGHQIRMTEQECISFKEMSNQHMKRILYGRE